MARGRAFCAGADLSAGSETFDADAREDRVEDAEIGRGVGAAAGGPLPAQGVVGEVGVDERVEHPALGHPQPGHHRDAQRAEDGPLVAGAVHEIVIRRRSNHHEQRHQNQHAVEHVPEEAGHANPGLLGDAHREPAVHSLRVVLVELADRDGVGDIGTKCHDAIIIAVCGKRLAKAKAGRNSTIVIRPVWKRMNEAPPNIRAATLNRFSRYSYAETTFNRRKKGR